MDGGRRLGVVGRAEVAPDLWPGGAAVLGQRRLVDGGIAELAAAALAEDAADQRGGGDHVGPLPGQQRLADRRVLARQLGRVELGLGDVLVDAGDVVVQVLLELDALGAVDVVGEVDLLLQVGLGVGRDRPLLGVHRLVRAAGEARELGAAGVAQHVHEEEAVLGADVAGAEHQVGAVVGVDVGDVELVAGHRDPGARAVGALDVVGLDAEAARP